MNWRQVLSVQEDLKRILDQYKIRGDWTPDEILQHWDSFKKKYPATKLSFEQWLVGYGKIYFKKHESLSLVSWEVEEGITPERVMNLRAGDEVELDDGTTRTVDYVWLYHGGPQIGYAKGGCDWNHIVKILSSKIASVETLEAPVIEKPYHSTRKDYKGNEYFYDEKGEYHNTSGPAFIGYDGEKMHYLHGKTHNSEGPALIHPDGSVEYSLYGERLTEDEFNRKRKHASLWREVLCFGK